jgi:hypothetical protein
MQRNISKIIIGMKATKRNKVTKLNIEMNFQPRKTYLLQFKYPDTQLPQQIPVLYISLCDQTKEVGGRR